MFKKIWNFWFLFLAEIFVVFRKKNTEFLADFCTLSDQSPKNKVNWIKTKESFVLKIPRIKVIIPKKLNASKNSCKHSFDNIKNLSHWVSRIPTLNHPQWILKDSVESVEFTVLKISFVVIKESAILSRANVTVVKFKIMQISSRWVREKCKKRWRRF